MTGKTSTPDLHEEVLSDLRSRSLLREIRTIEDVDGSNVIVNGRRLINFASNDYLGLSQHPALKVAAQEAIGEFGVGAGASRLITGSQTLHMKLEQELDIQRYRERITVQQRVHCCAWHAVQLGRGRGHHHIG